MSSRRERAIEIAIEAAVVAIVVSSYVGWRFHSQNSEQEKYRRLLHDIDNNTAKIFLSIDDCRKQGFSESSCVASQSAAFKWDKTSATSKTYDDPVACTSLHRTCQESKITYLTSIKPPVSDTRYIYKPDHLAGWQALSSDLTKAAPLYPTWNNWKTLRWDGKMINLHR